MKHALPRAVVDAPTHMLLLLPGDATVTFYLREDEFTAARYPKGCRVEYMFPVWDDGQVMCPVLLAQLAGRHIGTFDRWINAAEPEGLRLVQLLASQKSLDLHLVTDRMLRSFSQANYLAGKAAGLVATLRVRRSWTCEEYNERRQRLETLYPSPERLWRAAREMKQ
ncbi:MAG: hypothetical protein PVJ57_09525 [Phycisphaerae bacterium]|jgi:hypothetical protein